MPEVVVLGSGTSTGVPVLGLDYPERFLANPKNWRTRPSIAILGPSKTFLVDCPPDMRMQLLRERIGMVDAVLITHTHADHIMGMDDLRAFCQKGNMNMPVYSLPIHHEVIKNVYPYAFVDFDPGIAVPRFDLKAVPQTLTFDGMEIRFGSVMHGAMPVTSLRLGNFCYMTDFSLIPEESEWLLEGLETLIMACVRFRPHKNHMHFEEVMKVIERVKPKKTYLTHLSHDFEDGVTPLPEGVELAYDGLRVPLNV
jgi:phosphoribosyl 1,2-cyclic phosphate phosphodiesterase